MREEHSKHNPGQSAEDIEWHLSAGAEHKDRTLLNHETFYCNGKRIEFYGVSHIPETAKKYAHEFHEAFKSAGTVLLECGPHTSMGHSDKSRDLVQEAAKLYEGRELSEEELCNFLDMHRPGVRFFNMMKYLAENYNKPIVSADPLTLAVDEKLVDREIFISKAKIFLAMEAAGLGMAIDSKRFKSGSSPATSKKSVLGRRAFVGLMGGVMAASGASALITNENNNHRLQRADNKLGILIHNLLDYRNVVVAEGLDRLTRDSNIKEPIVVVYGDYHRREIRFYLEHPKERKVKRNTYKPYDQLAEPRMKKFNFDQQNKSWLIESEDSL
jgi:hypothetical protein